jgi:hypothetical protein
MYFVVKPFKDSAKWLSKLYKRLLRGLFWNNWLITVKESYLVIALTAFISFKYYFSFEEWGDRAQTASALVFTVFYVVLPLSTFIFILVRFKDLNKTRIKRRIGDFYEGLDLSKGKQSLIYTAAFYLRRIYLPWMIVFGPRDIILQSSSIYYTTIA